MLLHSSHILLLKLNFVKLAPVICGLKCQSLIHMANLCLFVSNVNMEAVLNLPDTVLDLLSILNQLEVVVHANKGLLVHLDLLEIMETMEKMVKTVMMHKMDVMVMF